MKARTNEILKMPKTLKFRDEIFRESRKKSERSVLTPKMAVAFAIHRPAKLWCIGTSLWPTQNLSKRSVGGAHKLRPAPTRRSQRGALCAGRRKRPAPARNRQPLEINWKNIFWPILYTHLKPIQTDRNDHIGIGVIGKGGEELVETTSQVTEQPAIGEQPDHLKGGGRHQISR